jgi:Ca2+-binding RTX toxin-like protein
MMNKKSTILISLILLAAAFAAPARAEAGPLTLVVAGSGGNDNFHFSLSPDGREYLILSAAPLEVGGDLCSHPREQANELACKAPAISGFEVNSGAGSDTVVFTSDIPVPATIRGGPGSDRLTGGGASDKIIGGPGADVLAGQGGDDWILGGPGQDRLLGGTGNDQLRGGSGEDTLVGGPGHDFLLQ